MEKRLVSCKRMSFEESRRELSVGYELNPVCTGRGKENRDCSLNKKVRMNGWRTKFISIYSAHKKIERRGARERMVA